jgi:hypothetical protein
MNLWYIAVRSFSPAHKDWQKYIEQSGLKSLREIISLDQIICPPAIRRFEAEDWNHNVHENFFSDYFLDLDYLVRRSSSLENIHILAVVRAPDKEIRDDFASVHFRFVGYDLTDRYGGNSILTNCGPLPLAFSPRDLSSFGLIYTYKRAAEVQTAINHYYADELSDCTIWALWQRIG